MATITAWENLWPFLLMGILLNVSMTLGLTERDFERMINSGSYSPSKTPGHDADKTTVVKVGMYVNSMDVYPKRGVMELHMYLRQAWRDERLAFDGNDSFQVPLTKMDSVWQPDTFFRNARSVKDFDVPNVQKLMRINQTGHVWYVTKIAVELFCGGIAYHHRGHRRFFCPIMLESYSYTMDRVDIQFLKHPFDVDRLVYVKDFTVEETILYDCSQNYTAGSFTCKEIRILFSRSTHSSTYAVGSYISSFILVVLSWVGFWMPHGFMKERLALQLVILFLLSGVAAGVALYNQDWMDKPPINIWMNFCITMVAMTLVEFIFVHAIAGILVPRVKGMRQPQGQTRLEDDPTVTSSGVEPLTLAPPSTSYSKLIGYIDLACGVMIFPLIFIIINLYFWIMFAP